LFSLLRGIVDRAETRFTTTGAVKTTFCTRDFVVVVRGCGSDERVSPLVGNPREWRGKVTTCTTTETASHRSIFARRRINYEFLITTKKKALRFRSSLCV